MDNKTLIRTAMAERGIIGIKELSRLSGVSYPICIRAVNNNGSIRVRDLKTIFDTMGYQLTIKKEVLAEA